MSTLKSPTIQSLFYTVGVALACTALGGCSSNYKEPDAQYQKRLDVSKQMGELIQKAHGNYDSLSAEDKAKLDAATGSAANSKVAISRVPTH